ncbi:MAG: altronate dehydratase family protein [Bacteroidales bacterium]|jgi:altronate hydrolase|nr:altronate dehydratase family protein [Bacteroidales bacterium]
MKNSLKINSADNVAVAILPLKKGDVAEGVTLLEDLDAGHKFALAAIAENANVIKYGNAIGHATQAIPAGAWVHTHNLKTNLHDNLEYAYQPNGKPLQAFDNGLTFDGYLRPNGDAGIRNELWIVPTVGCVNGQAQAIVNRVKAELDCSHLDDVRVWAHNYGCSQLGDDHQNTKKALVALTKHPNAAGVLVLGLGCENNQMADFVMALGNYDQSRIKTLIAQEMEDEIATGFDLMKDLWQQSKADKRQPLPLSKLKIGLKCGGSDGFSGITANPLVGLFSDWLIAQGGSTILTEVPEMFGAETILMNRTTDATIFDKTVHLINDFKDYFRKYDQPIYENPSPGNKKGGISTLEDKSLGCTQKGGNAQVVDVLKYTEPIKIHGLNLLNSPGNDLVAASALGFSGCQMVLFTTGRGTPFGSFVPTMKISTNSKLYNFKNNWIDFNAGSILENETMNECLQRFVSYMLEICSGKHLKHEITGFKEIAIFKTGVTL